MAQSSIRAAAWSGLACLLLGGCVERTLNVDSTPRGSLVYLNGEEVGRTPLKRDFLWYGNYDVEVSHDGYNTLTTKQKVTPPVFQWIPFDLFAEILPIPFHDNQQFTFNLTPEVGAMTPVQGKTLAQRGEALRSEMEGPRKPSTNGAE